ncbi:MAG TPA: phosphoribosyltransferase family protein [Patescibacteria group bacterium]|nr:phosphoribosyltransferase family protein [Patescibacteria group bacterium]
MISEKPNWQTPEAEAIINSLKETFLQEAWVADQNLIIAPSLDRKIDPRILEAAAQVVDLRFKGMGVNKVLGIPNLGLPFATAVALTMPGVRLVPACKETEKPRAWLDNLSAERRTLALNVVSSIRFSLVETDDRILLVDNVCAYGQTASEVIQTLNQQTEAEVVGLAVLMSKDFQGGLRRIEERFKIPTLGVIRIQEIGPNQEIILGQT